MLVYDFMSKKKKKTIADEIRRKWTKMDSVQFLF